MEEGVSSPLSPAKQRQKRYFNMNVQRQQTFKVGNGLFVERPKLPAIAIYAVDKMANRR